MIGDRIIMRPRIHGSPIVIWPVETMRRLEELLNDVEPAWPLVADWIAKAVRPCEVLPPSPTRGDILVQTQVTTRSPMGAVVYESGGLLIDHGWLRFLGSGHPRLQRTLPEWNDGRSNGFYLVADDAVGGFFAINGGAFGEDIKDVYYFAPDSLDWISLKGGYSELLCWALTENLDSFYDSLRWPGWENDVASLSGDRCFFFSPPLFTKEGSVSASRRGDVSVAESWGVQMDFRKQLGP